MAEHNLHPRTILITGASSGIGRALALHYARDGVILGLTGRDAERLSAVTAQCENRGAKVLQAVLDVTDKNAMEEWITLFDQAHPVDLVIANAGVSAGTGGVLIGEPPEQVRHVLDVNLNGVLNTIEPLQSRMIARKNGQIAIISSLAGFRGWPGAPAYCASKAAVKVYGESLRGCLAESGIRVNVICPGFVESRMTAVNSFPMPFMVSAEKAAATIARGLSKNRGRIAFPLVPSLCIGFVSMLPDPLAQMILRRMPAKSMGEPEN